MRQKIKLKQGIASDNAKKIVAVIKDSKLKAQASIQGDTVRVVSKDRDMLQQIMAKLRGRRLRGRAAVHELPLQLARFSRHERRSGCAITP